MAVAASVGLAVGTASAAPAHREITTVKSKGAAMAAAHISQKHLGLTDKHQVTFYGHPLYSYVGDTAAKQRTEKAQAFGAGWYVVGTNGKAVDNS